MKIKCQRCYSWNSKRKGVYVTRVAADAAGQFYQYRNRGLCDRCYRALLFRDYYV